MFVRQASNFTHKIQSKKIYNVISKGYNFNIVKCFVKHNSDFSSNVPAQSQQSFVDKKDKEQSNDTSQIHMKSSTTKSKKSYYRSSFTSLKLKFSTDKESLIKELKERTAKMAEKYANDKEWKEEELDLLSMALEIHNNRWKFIHKQYFNYRTLHSIKCKWDREKVKYENSCKKITSEWTPEEDEILFKGIEKYGREWRKISRMLPNKEAMQVYRRYSRINYTKRGNFTEEEDNLLCELLRKYGGNYWHKIAEDMNRPNFTLRKHYKSVLLNSPEWTDKENKLISDSILKYGKDWKKIQKLLPHRLSPCIKEHVRFCPFADPYYNTGFWELDEIMKLVKAVRLYGKSWQKVSKFVETRSPFQCRIYFRDSFTRKNLESYVLNLELEGIQSIFPTERDQAFLEKIAAEHLLMELRSSDQESKNVSSETVSSDQKFLETSSPKNSL